MSVSFQVTGGTSTGTIGVVAYNGDGTYTAIFTGQIAGSAAKGPFTAGIGYLSLGCNHDGAQNYFNSDVAEVK